VEERIKGGNNIDLKNLAILLVGFSVGILLAVGSTFLYVDSRPTEVINTYFTVYAGKGSTIFIDDEAHWIVSGVTMIPKGRD